MLLLVLAASLLWAEDLGIFTGEATVSLANLNLSAAKKKATTIALAQAVEKALGQVAAPADLERKKKAIKERILADPQRFVVSFSVLQSEERATEYYLSVEARIRLDALREEIQAILTPPPTARERPRLAVIPFHRKQQGVALDADLEKALRDRLSAGHQSPADAETAELLLALPAFMAAADGSPQDLAHAAAGQGIRLLVLLDLHDETPPDVDDVSCKETATVRLIDTQSAAEVDHFSYTFPADRACARTVDQAAQELYAGVTEVLNRHGLAGATGSPALLIEVDGVHSFARLQELQTLLRRHAGMQAVDLDSFQPGGRVVFHAIFTGPVEQLIDDLQKARDLAFRIKLVGQHDNVLQFTLE